MSHELDGEKVGLIQKDVIDATPPKKTYGTFAGFAISVNYIIGTGVFG